MAGLADSWAERGIPVSEFGEEFCEDGSFESVIESSPNLVSFWGDKFGGKFNIEFGGEFGVSGLVCSRAESGNSASKFGVEFGSEAEEILYIPPLSVPALIFSSVEEFISVKVIVPQAELGSVAASACEAAVAELFCVPTSSCFLSLKVSFIELNCPGKNVD